MNYKKILGIGMIAIMTTCSLTACSKVEPTSFTGYAMGTVINETIYSDNDGNSTAMDIEKAIADAENTYLSAKISKSELSQINNNAANNAVKMSSTLSGYIHTLFDISKSSDGAFDPTVGKLSSLWDFDSGSEKIPNDSDIQSCLNAGNYQNVSIVNDMITLPDGMKLDLGAAGKGIALDISKEILDKDSQVTGAVISVGESSILTYGDNPNDKDNKWKIDLRNPRDKESIIGSLILDGTNYIATSGDYQKYFEKNGKRYHHILDPKTGYPAKSDIISVTVIAKDGISSDALSTACFVLGEVKGIELLEKYGAEAVIIDSNLNITTTKGAEKIWVAAE